MNQETLFSLVHGQQQRMHASCQREAELAKNNNQSGAIRQGKLQRLVEWLRPTYHPIGLIQLTDLEE